MYTNKQIHAARYNNALWVDNQLILDYVGKAEAHKDLLAQVSISAHTDAKSRNIASDN